MIFSIHFPEAGQGSDASDPLSLPKRLDTFAAVIISAQPLKVANHANHNANHSLACLKSTHIAHTMIMMMMRMRMMTMTMMTMMMVVVMICL